MIKLTGNKIAVTPIFDPDKSEGRPSYTREEIAGFKDLGWDMEKVKFSSGSLIIPDDAKERCDQGIVKYVGPGVKDVKIGQYVLFGGYDGTTVRLEGEGVLIILREWAVTCVIEDVGKKIEGLYFKEKPTQVLISEMLNILGSHGIVGRLQALIAGEIINSMNDHSPYFPATHESVIELIASQQEPIEHKNKYKNREDPNTGHDEDEE